MQSQIPDHKHSAEALEAAHLQPASLSCAAPGGGGGSSSSSSSAMLRRGVKRGRADARGPAAPARQQAPGEAREREACNGAARRAAPREGARRRCFVVCPGAGGTLPRELRGLLVPLLEQLGQVLLPSRRIGAPPPSLEWLRHLHDRVSSAPSEADVWLVGQSYGSRLAAHYLAGVGRIDEQDAPPEVPANVKGLLAFGFPLTVKDAPERSVSLTRLPTGAGLRYMFVSGSEDDKLGELARVLAASPAKPELVLVPGGRHDCCDVREKDSPEVGHELVRAAVQRLVAL